MPQNRGLASLRIAKRHKRAKLLVGVGTGLGKTALDPLGHQVVLVISIAALAIDLFGAGVLSDHLQMDRSDFEGAGLVFDERQRAFTPAFPPMALAQVELVKESVAAKILKAVAESEDDVSDGRRVVADQPGPSQRRFKKEGDKSNAGALGIEGVAVKGVVLTHHLE